MVDWWFEWHPHEDLRYRVWFPPAHAANRVVQRAPGGGKDLWGMTHFPVEDIGLGMQHLRIAFQRPTDLGFRSDGTDRPELATIVCGLAGDPKMHLSHSVMAHVFLRAGEGVVLRSRFWLGAAIAPDLPSPLARAGVAPAQPPADPPPNAAGDGDSEARAPLRGGVREPGDAAAGAVARVWPRAGCRDRRLSPAATD